MNTTSLTFSREAAASGPVPRFIPLRTERVGGLLHVVLPDAPSVDAATIAGWFHDDRRKAAAQALQVIYATAAQSRAKGAPEMMVLADLARQALLDGGFDVRLLVERLGPVH